jgi:hypothetical protein
LNSTSKFQAPADPEYVANVDLRHPEEDNKNGCSSSEDEKVKAASARIPAHV